MGFYPYPLPTPYPHAKSGYFALPATPPFEYPYPCARYGYLRGRVRVALGYPRVICDNHYLSCVLLLHLPLVDI
jgi:hypothetical protein